MLRGYPSMIHYVYQPCDVINGLPSVSPVTKFCFRFFSRLKHCDTSSVSISKIKLH